MKKSRKLQVLLSCLLCLTFSIDAGATSLSDLQKQKQETQKQEKRRKYSRSTATSINIAEIAFLQ